MTLLACKAKGATNIIVADVFENRLNKALELGATAAINSAAGNVAEKVEELTGGRYADIVFETAGRPETTLIAADIVRRGGHDRLCRKCVGGDSLQVYRHQYEGDRPQMYLQIPECVSARP